MVATASTRITMPLLEAWVELPELLDPSGPANSRVNRVHSKAVKDAMRKTLNYHHRNHMPKHFQAGNAARYRHRQRSSSYNASKQRLHGSAIDLVKRGKLRRQVLRGKKTVRIGGSSDAGKVTGRMTYKFPRGVQENSANGGVTLSDIRRELQEFTTDEAKVLAQLFVNFYVEEIDKNIKSKRVRKRLTARLSALGITP